MMDSIVEWARENWVDWFGDAPGPLTASILAGGPAHRERFSAFLFAEGHRSPRVYLKVGRGAVESERVEREASTVRELSNVGRDGLAARLPEVYGTLRRGESLAAAYSVVPGQRLLVPPIMAPPTRLGRRSIRRFLQQTGELGSGLARLPSSASPVTALMLGDRVAEFCRRFQIEGGALEALASFRQSLEHQEGQWPGCWQHGDVAVGNVLVDHGVIRLLDWEAASNEYEPWFDLATAPVAMVILARRQSGRSLQEAAEHVLSPASWTGEEIRAVIARLWSHSISPGSAVTLTAVRMALRRSSEGRVMHDDYADFASLACTDASVRELVSSIGSTG